MKEAGEGDVIILPDVQCLPHAYRVGAESFPGKHFVFCTADETQHPDPSSGLSVDNMMRLRTMQGDPPTPEEIQQWLDYERGFLKKRRAIKSKLQGILDEFLGDDMGSFERMETAETLIQEMAHQMSVCVHSTARGLGKTSRERFLSKAEQHIQTGIVARTEQED
jgi:hypothetical protein